MNFPKPSHEPLDSTHNQFFFILRCWALRKLIEQLKT